MEHEKRTGPVATCAIIVLALTLWGCGGPPVGVWRLGSDRVFGEMTANATNSHQHSGFSTQILARFNLTDEFDDDPEAVLVALHRRAERETNRENLFTLAELSYVTAKNGYGREHYLAAVVYAYIYLFSEETAGDRDPYDPRFRVASSLYNLGLTKFLTNRKGDVEFESGTYELPFGTLALKLERPGFPWGRDRFERFVPANDFKVRGLRARYNNWGLGASLIAIGNENSEQRDAYFASGTDIAATAFLRLSLETVGVEQGGMQIDGSLELYAPFNVLEIEVHGRRVPLQADLTAPVAYALEESRIWDFELGGFLSSGKEELARGIFMLQPYSRGKIPLVFVHGTASSPARWAEMFNELQGYRDLRETYQFWFFMYNTGNPIAYSASLLRDALHGVVEYCDPEASDPALQQMVVIGHSQGGLLTKMQTFDSGDRFWRLTSDDDFADLDLPEKEKEVLRKAIFFERVPSVRRVVFISTPHRGSFLAGKWLGRLASSMVSLPGEVVDIGRALFEKDQTIALKNLDIPTSINNMDPENEFLKTIASSSIAPEVTAHSIIPVKGDGPITEGNDGVVEYKSAHIEGVASEFVVSSGHSCQGHPDTILEVRRILLEHLKASRAVSKAEQ